MYHKIDIKKTSARLSRKFNKLLFLAVSDGHFNMKVQAENKIMPDNRISLKSVSICNNMEVEVLDHITVLVLWCVLCGHIGIKRVCLWNPNPPPLWEQGSKLVIFRIEVKVTRSFTLVSFERVSFVEYACMKSLSLTVQKLWPRLKFFLPQSQTGTRMGLS